MFQAKIRDGISAVHAALIEPEDFAIKWRDGLAKYPLATWFALLSTAIAGTTTYGMIMGMGEGGVQGMLRSGLLCTCAAGLAWSIPLPALYIFNSFTGSKLDSSTTILAAMITTSWGGLAMIASIPITWFFSAAIPSEQFIFFVNLIVFTGVGLSMVDVFGRVFQRLEPNRGRTPAIWLLFVSAIGGQLFYLFGLFQI